MDDLTDEEEFQPALSAGNAHPDLPLVLSVDQGEYVIFPNGIHTFAEKHGAEAVAVDPDGHIHILTTGLGNRMMWVKLTVDHEEGSDVKRKR